jgi:hypothetical protein
MMRVDRVALTRARLRCKIQELCTSESPLMQRAFSGA